MSQSKKDAVGGHRTHGIGYEFWSNRPLSRRCGATPGRWTKTITHRIERRRSVQLVRREVADVAK